MKVIIGIYAFLTKLHLIELKQKLDVPFTYIRSDFDHIIIDIDDNSKAYVYQDGLCYIETNSYNEKKFWVNWIKKNIFSKMLELNDDPFYQEILSKKDYSMIVINSKKDVFKELNLEKDYAISSKNIVKSYGSGLAVFESTLTQKKLSELVQIQLIFQDYQTLIREMLNYNKSNWNEVYQLRSKKKYFYKDLPLLINKLFEQKRLFGSLLSGIGKLDDFIVLRESKTSISSLLNVLKLNDFNEMKALNNYVHDQLVMTKEYIDSSINLINFLYKENEQKEFNILQVIFAIGTIASLIALGAMPGSKISLFQTNSGFEGNLISFDRSDLFFWSIVSIVSGIAIFMILNFLFLHAKKFRIVTLIGKD